MMLLEFGSEEEFEFRIAAFDPPAGENVRESFGADDAFAPEVFRVVPIEPACRTEFSEVAHLGRAPTAQTGIRRGRKLH